MKMDRRAFIAGISAALAVEPTRAQPSRSMRVVGLLMGLAKDAETEARIKTIEDGLAKRGWIPGKNLRMVVKFGTADPERMLALAKELVALQPNVIIAHSTPAAAALHQVTQTIPIVFVVVADPVGSGLVASIARPAGNITGFTVLQPTITGKYLSILRELEPHLARVAVLYDSESIPEGGEFYLPTFVQSAREFNVTPVTANVHSAAEIEAAMNSLGATPNSGLIAMAGNFISSNRGLIISLAARLRIPAIYPYRYFAADGGLLSYGVDILDLFRRAPDYVDRILRGANPADLPVQAPRKFELVINLKTAHALGLVVPRILLAGADDLIE